MIFKPKELTTQELLRHYGLILSELRSRGVIRTANAPIGDYAEFIVSEKLGLTLETSSTSGYDAVDSSGLKFQIKGRRVTRQNPSRQLGAIRNLERHEFDYLIAVLFNEAMEIEQVIKVPHQAVAKYAGYSSHVNAHILVLRSSMLNDQLVEDITPLFRK